MAERFRRPFQKRHSSLPHQPTNRVNKYLAQAIDARSVDREKSNHVNVVSLCFRNKEKEQQVGEEAAERRWSVGWMQLLMMIYALGNKRSVLNYTPVMVTLIISFSQQLVKFTKT